MVSLYIYCTSIEQIERFPFLIFNFFFFWKRAFEFFFPSFVSSREFYFIFSSFWKKKETRNKEARIESK